MKKFKILFWITTGLLSLQMLMSAGMYVFNNQVIREAFMALQFPTYIIYPLAIAKILGVIVLWIPFYKNLKEWAYAGFFFNFLLAGSAHINVADGQQIGAIIALILLGCSYFASKKMNG